MHTEFGFSPSNFTGVERGEAYEVQVGYLSGRPSGNQELTFNVVFINGTAGKYITAPSGGLMLLKSNAMATLHAVLATFFFTVTCCCCVL